MMGSYLKPWCWRQDALLSAIACVVVVITVCYFLADEGLTFFEYVSQREAFTQFNVRANRLIEATQSIAALVEKNEDDWDKFRRTANYVSCMAWHLEDFLKGKNASIALGVDGAHSAEEILMQIKDRITTTINASHERIRQTRYENKQAAEEMRGVEEEGLVAIRDRCDALLRLRQSVFESHLQTELIHPQDTQTTNLHHP